MVTADSVYKGISIGPVLKIIDLWEQGMIDREVSDETGIPPFSIHGVRKVLGLKANRKHVATRTRRVAAKAMRADGMTVEDIAKVLKTPERIVNEWLESA